MEEIYGELFAVPEPCLRKKSKERGGGTGPGCGSTRMSEDGRVYSH